MGTIIPSESVADLGLAALSVSVKAGDGKTGLVPPPPLRLCGSVMRICGSRASGMVCNPYDLWNDEGDVGLVSFLKNP